jgi:hypothetical protein
MEEIFHDGSTHPLKIRACLLALPTKARKDIVVFRFIIEL